MDVSEQHPTLGRNACQQRGCAWVVRYPGYICGGIHSVDWVDGYFFRVSHAM